MIWTPTLLLSSTPRPTTTPVPTDTVVSSDTPSPTNTPQPTRTSLPTRTFTPVPTLYVISSNGPINARSCPRTDCEVITTLSPGMSVSVVERITGQEVNGDTNWLHIMLIDLDAYVHSSLASPMASQSSEAQPIGNAGATQASAGGVSTTICRANFARLGVNYRVSNSYDGGNYQRYSYVPIFETSQHIEYMLEVGREWDNPFPFNLRDLGLASGSINVDGVTVDYDFDGEVGWYESIAFSFEYAGLKFGGDISIYDDLADSSLDSSLTEELMMFVRAIIRIC